MKPEDFVHLHCHSTYSLLEGLPSPKEIVDRAAELGQGAVALTDKGYTHGLIEFYKACKERDMKPILGVQVYCAARTRFDREKGTDTKSSPLVLLAETQEGYANLLKISSAAALEGMYYKPRVDTELLRQHGAGLIALSGPLSGALPQAALAEDAERVKMILDEYRECFGSENVYFELMDLPGVPGQREANQQLIRFAKEFGVPLVAGCGSHYCRQEDAEAQDVLLCIQKNANVNDPGRFSMRASDLSMRSFDELRHAFDHVPEALEHTKVVAERCNVEITFGTYQIPMFPVPEKETEESLLRKQCEAGLPLRYGFDASSVPEDKKHIVERMTYELDVINTMGFAGYFLIVADFVQEAKRRGITVGPGRGSAAGSIVSYLLRITNLDPLEHGLLFERFLNPERISMPDIDMDFADTRRDEVLEYVREKYGKDKVVQICTFGTLAARAAVKDVGRVFGVPFTEMNELVKFIPERSGTKLAEALESPDLASFIKTNDTYRKIVEIALKLEGKARHVSVHACGVVITPKPAVEYTALQRAPKDEDTVITQYDAKPLEALGLLKMDFLGLKNLTIIQTTLEIIERMHGTKIDISSIPIDDPEAFALLSRAETTGVFQLESGGMRRYLKQLKPTRFEDIVVMCALYRPGPMDSIPEYIKRKNNPSLIKYEVPELEPFLRETYGIMVYQEQVQRVVQEFAGFSLGAGYLLIKAVAKKIPSLLNEQREKFLEGARGKGRDAKTAEKIFALIEPFAGYGFNKSHSASYARIAYETAYLKARYPTEFMAALLSSEGGDTDRISVEIAEARTMDIRVLPPDINESLAHFTALPDKKIRFGLAAIKGVGESSVRAIIAVREEGGKFTSLEDFARRVPTKLLNKKVLESLAKAGALDSLCERGLLVTQGARVLEFNKASGDIAAAQTDLFGGSADGEDAVKIAFEEQEPSSGQQRLLWEKETLGLYVSSHPLAGLSKYLKKKIRLTGSFTKKDLKKKVTVGGVVAGIKKMRTKKGEGMAAVTLEDTDGLIEIMLFPRIYAQVAELLEESDTMLVAEGVLDMRAGQPQVRADAVRKASLTRMAERAKQEGLFDEEEVRNGLVRKQSSIDEDVSTDQEKEQNGDFLGPVAEWLVGGMDMAEPMKVLGLAEEAPDEAKEVTRISVHTIELPAHAPKSLLVELKSLFERFPGREKVQLKIGDSVIPVPLTVTVSPILEHRIEQAVAKHTGENASIRQS